jgi:hypothetical protein
MIPPVSPAFNYLKTFKHENKINNAIIAGLAGIFIGEMVIIAAERDPYIARKKFFVSCSLEAIIFMYSAMRWESNKKNLHKAVARHNDVLAEKDK